jgi:hypothetical protein
VVTVAVAAAAAAPGVRHPVPLRKKIHVREGRVGGDRQGELRALTGRDPIERGADRE